MAITSTFEYWAHVDTTHHAADNPVDAGRAMTVVNNLQHSYDVHFPHRVNWVAMDGNSGADIISGERWVYAMFFPLTTTRDGLPPNLDIRIGMYHEVGGVTSTLNGWIVPWNASIVTDGSAADSDAIVAFEQTGITTSTPGYAYEDQIFFDQGTDNEQAKWAGLARRAQYTPLIITEDSEVHASHMALWKAVLIATKTAGGSGNSRLAGLQIREFG